MDMKNERLMISAIVVILLLIFVLPNFVLASTDLSTDLGVYRGDGGSSTQLQQKANVVLKVIQTLGIVASVVVLIILGIKYMMGSTEDKANYKQTMIPYLIGAALLFTGSTLPQMIYNFVKDL